MVAAMMRACAVAMLALTFGASLPASAQIMKPDGFEIPWFRSTTERHAREACEQNLPECRADVRQEIAKEKIATTITPWLLLGIAVLAVLFYLRGQERKRVKKRRVAQMRHDPGAFRKLDKVKEDRQEDDDAEHDRFAL